jgi:hypothetical protein
MTEDWVDPFTYENVRNEGVNAFRGLMCGLAISLIVFWVPFIVWLYL